MRPSTLPRLLALVPLLGLGACAAAPSVAPPHRGVEIDAVAVNPGKYTVLLENEYVRVIRYEIKPGESEEIHTHPPKLSYVLTGGTLRIVPEEGAAFEVTETAGSAVWRGAFGKHHAENIGATGVEILLVEVKAAAK